MGNALHQEPETYPEHLSGDPMSADYRFIKVHNGFPEHRKTVGLSDRAFRDLIELWCYCSRNTTDGLVPKLLVNRMVTKRSRSELIAAPFMIERDQDFEMLDYLDHQISSAQISDLQKKRADAGRKGGQAKAKGVALASDGVQAKTYLDRDIDRDIEKDVADATDLPRDDIEKLCTYLADRVEQNGSKRPNVTKGWRTEARLLLDRDKRTVDQVIKAIDFSQESSFWRINIMSMPKLREKYDALRLAATQETGKTQRGPNVIQGAPGQMRIEQ
jgi:hypothetical protein